MTTAKKPPTPKKAPEAGTRDNARAVGPAESLDRFAASNVRRGEDRVALAASMNLGGVTIDEGMHGRWFQDKDGRLDQAMQAGYEAKRDHTGKPICRRKGEYPLYLMQLPMHLRKQDLDKKAQETNNVLIEKNRLAAGEYVPGKQDGSRQHVMERDRSKDFDPLN